MNEDFGLQNRQDLASNFFMECVARRFSDFAVVAIRDRRIKV